MTANLLFHRLKLMIISFGKDQATFSLKGITRFNFMVIVQCSVSFPRKSALTTKQSSETTMGVRKKTYKKKETVHLTLHPPPAPYGGLVSEQNVIF